MPEQKALTEADLVVEVVYAVSNLSVAVTGVSSSPCRYRTADRRRTSPRIAIFFLFLSIESIRIIEYV